jgi:hypothetical protein
LINQIHNLSEEEFANMISTLDAKQLEVLYQELEREKGAINPNEYIERVFKVKLWGKQKQIVEAVRDNKRTAVRSGHGVGKSFISGKIALEFLMCHPNSIVITTAPTKRQVEAILWKEIRIAHHRGQLPGTLLKTKLELRDGWVALGFTTNNPNSFQGLHAEYVLVIFDEATGIDPQIWEAAEGILTGPKCRFLCIGNPTEQATNFGNEFRKPDVKKIHISVFDSPNFTEFGITQKDIEEGTWQKKITKEMPYPELVEPSWAAEKFKEWGGKSAAYQSRVLGNFPTEGTDTLIPQIWVEAAANRELDPGNNSKELGVDVAYMGSDENIIVFRQGPVARIIDRWTGIETTTSARNIMHLAEEYDVETIKIDVIGVGAGVFDQVKEACICKAIEVIPIQVSEAPADPEKFKNARAEYYKGLAERFEYGNIDIDPDDEDLHAELSSIKYRITPAGQYQIQAKDEMKKEMGKSPDMADAFMIAFAHNLWATPLVGAVNLHRESGVI